MLIFMCFFPTLETKPKKKHYQIDAIEVVFLIRSELALDVRTLNGKQGSRQMEGDLVNSLRAEAASVSDLWPPVHLKVQVFNDQLDDNIQHPGEWTVLNILSQFAVMNSSEAAATSTTTSAHTSGIEPAANRRHLINGNTRWIIICERTTSVNVSILLRHLALHDYKQVFITGSKDSFRTRYSFHSLQFHSMQSIPHDSNSP